MTSLETEPQIEETVWSLTRTSGFWPWKKKIQSQYVLTDKRVICNNASLAYSDIDDIIAINVQWQSAGSYMSTGVYHRGLVSRMGSTKSKGRQTGDVIFVSGRYQDLVFSDLIFPTGVRDLAKSLARSFKKQLEMK